MDEGREIHADFKLIAKYFPPLIPCDAAVELSELIICRAFGRIGTNYVKMEEYDMAIEYFNRSLTEHRTPEILNKLRDVPHLI